MRRTDIKLILFVAVLTSLSLLFNISCTPADDPADTEAPTVTLTSPVDGAMAPNAIDVRADASDNVEVTKVEFYCDGALYHTDETAPYAGFWTAEADQAGEHTFYARAYDAAANSGSSSEVRVNCAITPPAQVTDLAATVPDMDGGVTLSWTAPGGDGSTGTAAEYDVRMYYTDLTEENWASAIPCAGAPTPQTAGSAESFNVDGLSLSNTYYFALRAIDAEGNRSEISNCISVTTQDLFGDEIRIPINADAQYMTVADMDSDGNIDVILGMEIETDNIQVLYGNGDGTFETTAPFNGRGAVSALGASDFDHDGDVDLVAANNVSIDTVIIDIQSWPDSTFDTTFSDVIDHTDTFWIDDVIDYIDTFYVVDYIDTTIVKLGDSLWAEDAALLTIVNNQGARTFEQREIEWGFFDTSYFWCIMPLYVNMPDGSVICVGCIDSKYESIPRYEPHPLDCEVFTVFEVDSTLVEYCTWAEPSWMCVDDLNNDGWDDLAVANFGISSASVSLNRADGSGTFINARDTLPGGSGSGAVTTGDLNGDGYADLAISAFNVDQISLYFNDGTGHFSGEDRATFFTPDFPGAPCLADYDNDGDLDIIVAGRGTNFIGIAENDGGDFPPNATEYLAGRGAAGVIAEDFDNDGDIDIAVTNMYDHNVSILLSKGEFQYYSFNTIAYDVGAVPVNIYSNDLDSDGDLDLIVWNRDTYDLSILFNHTITP